MVEGAKIKLHRRSLGAAELHKYSALDLRTSEGGPSSLTQTRAHCSKLCKSRTRRVHDVVRGQDHLIIAGVPLGWDGWNH
jgi:hypothetical protein